MLASLASPLASLVLALAAQHEDKDCNPCTSYKDGFILEANDGTHRLRLRGLIQGRASLQLPELDVARLSPTFAIQRAQIELSGHLFTKQLTYQMKTEWGQGFTFIKDAYANYEIVPSWLEVRAGAWKRPFARQEVTSDWKQAFVDRSITNAFFGAGRDLGVALHNDIDKSRPIEWAFGLFAGGSDRPTGSGIGTLDPTDPKTVVVENVRLTNVRDPMLPTAVARIGFNRGDVKGYNEIDTDGGDLRFGVAASVLESVDIAGNGEGVTRAEVDAIVKIAHVDASGAIFVGAKQAAASSFAQRYDATGFHVQTGVLLFEQLHPGVRYDYIAVVGDDNDIHELTTGLTWLAFGQNVQLQLDTSIFLHEADGFIPAMRARAQLGMSF